MDGYFCETIKNNKIFLESGIVPKNSSYGFYLFFNLFYMNKIMHTFLYRQQ